MPRLTQLTDAAFCDRRH